MARKHGDKKHLPRGVLERPAGSGIYWIYYCHEGRRYYEKVGTDLEEAKDLYICRKAAKLEGRAVPGDLRRGAGVVQEGEGPYTVHQAVQSYLDVATQNRSRSADIYHARKILNEFGDNAIDSLTAGDIERWMAKRVSETSPTTANLGLEFFGRCIRRAVRDHLCEHDPTHEVKPLRKPPPRDRYLTQDEAAALRKHLPKAKIERDWLIIILAGYTGLRRGNVFGIRRREVDFQQGLISVPRTKNNRPKLVPIHPELLPLLKAQLARSEGSEWLFPGREGQHPLRGWPWVRRRFNQARDKAGIENLRFHDLRHSFATWMLLGGASTRETQDATGHSDLASLQRYTHIPQQRQRDLVSQLSFLTPKPAVAQGRGWRSGQWKVCAPGTNDN